MLRDTRHGRSLWPIFVALLAAYAVADFANHPFLGSTGAARSPSPDLTLWLPRSDAQGGVAAVARGAAAGMTLQGRAVAVKLLPGGSAEAVRAFFDERRGGGAHLLVITSTTLSDLARDAREQRIPGAAAGALRAQALLGRATPIGVLSDDPLRLAVRNRSPLRRSGELLAALRADPQRHLFGIADDTWSEVNLAALVQSAGVDGDVPFSAYDSPRAALDAVEQADADVALATRSALASKRRRDDLRVLSWPLAGVPTPRSWVALVGQPELSPARTAKLRVRLTALLRDRGWRRSLRDEGRAPTRVAGVALERFITARTRDAERLELVAERVASR